MGFLVLLLLAVVFGGGLVIRVWLHGERIERVRDRARIRVIEGQLAAMRACMRISAAEYATRRRLLAHSRPRDGH